VETRLKCSRVGSQRACLVFLLGVLAAILVIAPPANAQSFTITPASLSITYANTPVNTCTSGLDVTVTNTGTVNVNITSYSFSPAPSLTAPFKLVNGWAPENLPAASNIIYTIKFCPIQAVTYNGTFTLNISGVSPITITLTGTGTTTGAIATLTPQTLNFGAVPIGSTSAPQTVNITNTGSTSMNVMSVWADPPYLVTGFNGKTQVLPGKSLPLQVTVSPSQPGSYPGNITIGYDVVNDNGVSLNATGTSSSNFGITSFPVLPSATQGAAYLAQLTTNGGTPPVTWSLQSGSSLPSGLSLSPSGAITGTVASSVAVGTYTFNVQATDSATHSLTQTATLVVGTPTGANCNDITFNDSSGNPLVPLTDLGTGYFLGQQGGLYPNGGNTDPAGHDSDGVGLAQQIVPLDSNGNPDPNGQYVFLSIGMSVAHIDFEGVVDRSYSDPTLNPHLVIVNGAQPRGDADFFADPNNGFWNPIFSDFLPDSGVTPNQVVAAWVLDDNAKPPTNFPSNMQTLQANFESIAQNLHTKFPNLKIAYFLSREYAGYSNSVANAPDAEPISYEVGWAPKWAIADQINGVAGMNWDPNKGTVMAPWVKWGPYTWTNGLLPRSDGFVWSCQDFQPDGHHPSQFTGKWKDSGVSLNFLKTDPTTRPWFLNPSQLVMLSPTAIDFGNQDVGTTSSPQNITLVNNQGVPLNISSIAPTGTNAGDFAQTNNCGSSVIAGGSCTISVTFSPTATGTRSANLTIADDAPGSPQSVSLTGTGVSSSTPLVSLSPTSLVFASQVIGTTSGGKQVKVTNVGSANLTVTAVAASGDYQETDTCVGSTILPNNTCTITVKFAPSLAGSITGAITLTDNAPNSPQVISTTGTGSYPVTLTPSLLTFASQPVGTSSTPKTVTLTNNQNTGLTFSFSGSGDYSASGGGTTPCGTTLAAKSRCTINVVFSPTFAGTIKGALTVTHNAAYSPQVVGLSGTATGGSGAPLVFNPPTGSFGKVIVGATSANFAITVTNKAPTSINISSFSASGNFSASAGGTNPCGGNLASKASCTIMVSFSPTTPGAVTGALTVNDNAQVTPQVLNLSGTGITPVSLSPTSLSFGIQKVGTTSSPQTVTVTNNQATTLTLNAITASGEYIVTNAGSTPCGNSLPAASSCTIGVEFSPSNTGLINGALTVTHNALFNPQTVPLTGTGQ